MRILYKIEYPNNIKVTFYTIIAAGFPLWNKLFYVQLEFRNI